VKRSFRNLALVPVLVTGYATAAGAQNICCNQTYALCIAATCALSANGESALCACTVESGWSIGPTACAERAPVQQTGFTTLVSTFSTALYASDDFYQGSGKDADCYGKPCISFDGENAVCLCPVSNESHAYWTEGGSCGAPQSGMVYSGASNPFEGGGLANLAQQLAKCSGTTAPTPTACSTSAGAAHQPSRP